MDWIEIPLGHARVALIDRQDKERVCGHSWWLDHQGYPRSNGISANGKKTYIRLHRFVMRAQKGDVVHHINRNKLDCRRSNLTMMGSISEHNKEHAQEWSIIQAKQKPARKTISGYKGVAPRPGRTKWRAQLWLPHRGEFRHIGNYTDPKEAALAHDRVAFELWGDKAVLNFPIVIKED